MSYRSLLPDDVVDERDPALGSSEVRDARDGSVYLVDKTLRLAIDAALSTGRPLLLRGEPGSGKSSLAPYIARILRWRYYEHVVTSRTSALDLLWIFDNVRKLADASLGQSRASQLDDHDYVEPGVLWWAMDPGSARRRGAPEDGLHPIREVEEPNAEINAKRARDRAVVLIDEIDKADPDVPNGLLVPLGSSEFRVAEINTVVSGRTVSDDNGGSNLLVILTTNEERDLPAALLRRCVSHTLTPASFDRMREIGRRHVANNTFLASRVDDAMITDLAQIIVKLRAEAKSKAIRPPSTAEFLDAVWACASLGVRTTDIEWPELQNLVLWKDDRL